MEENVAAAFDPFGEAFFEELANLVSRIEERDKENIEILVHLFGLVEAGIESLHQLKQSGRIPEAILRDLIQNFIKFRQEITRDLAKPSRDPRDAIFTNFSTISCINCIHNHLTGRHTIHSVIEYQQEQ